MIPTAPHARACRVAGHDRRPLILFAHFPDQLSIPGTRVRPLASQMHDQSFTFFSLWLFLRPFPITYSFHVDFCFDSFYYYYYYFGLLIFCFCLFLYLLGGAAERAGIFKDDIIIKVLLSWAATLFRCLFIACRLELFS